MSKALAEGSVAHAIVGEELRLLARVSSALSALSSSTTGAPDYDDALVNLRDQLAEAKPEDIAALVEQMTRISAIAQRYGKGRDLPVDPGSPYFAHMRLNQGSRQRDVLLGKRGFIDRGRDVQIVDWRNAPISRIYYRYAEDDDYEEEIGKRIVEGRLAARRSLTIEGGQLRRIACPQGTFVVENGRWFEATHVATAVLGGGQGKASRPPVLRRGGRGSTLGVHSGPVLRADKHLPEIAALIDPEQFDLITRPESGVAVLQGGAGTGKTTVALHRVAFLNYQLPKIFRPDRILVVVPTGAMVAYVQRVLPSLGVNNVRVITAAAWFERTRRRVFPHRTRRYNDDTPASVLRFKKHPLQLPVLAEYVAHQRRRFEETLRRELGALEETADIFAAWQRAAPQPLIPALLALRGAIDAARQLPALTRQRADTTVRRLLRRAADIFADWADIFTDRQALADSVERHCPGAFKPKQLDAVCSWCTRQCETLGIGGDADVNDAEAYVAADGRDEREEQEGGRLDRIDDALLLQLCALKRGELRPARGSAVWYEHVVVDEAQDLAAIELAVLVGTTTERRSVTLAGDTAQRLVFDNDFAGWERLLETLEIDAASSTNATLQLGYRSTGEVMALARALLGAADDEQAPQPTRGGAPVELHRFTDQGQAVAMLAEALRSLMLREPLASVALITRHAAQAKAYFHALREAEVPRLRLALAQDFSFTPGIEVTDAAQVKGLEFDYVVLLDVTMANYPDTLECRHLLHIGATRAAHQLWLVAVGRPSPLLPRTL